MGQDWTPVQDLNSNKERIVCELKLSENPMYKNQISEDGLENSDIIIIILSVYINGSSSLKF